MTPEQFEAKWGKALRLVGYECSAEGPAIIISRHYYTASHPIQLRTAEAHARGLLVAWAADRGWAVEHSGLADPNNQWALRFANDLPMPEYARWPDFDAALIAGCIALEEQENA